jgi:hypothetical protein
MAMADRARTLFWTSMMLLFLVAGIVMDAGDTRAEDRNTVALAAGRPVPFGVQPVRVETEVGKVETYSPPSRMKAAEGDRFAVQCHRQEITMSYADSAGPYIKFTGVKRWCFDGSRVTSGTMDVEPWIRPDSRYGPDQDGYVYVPAALKKTDRYLTYNGRSYGAHESVRVGRFEYRVRGFAKTPQVVLPYVSRIGYYNGACDGPKPKDVSPKVTTVRPTAGAQGVSPMANVEATFLTAMRASTLNSGTFDLVKRGSFDPVRASYRYDAATKKAILDPSARLAPGTYTATVYAGPFGALTSEGDPIISTKTWSFTVR